jgi:hypothetical protein
MIVLVQRCASQILPGVLLKAEPARPTISAHIVVGRRSGAGQERALLDRDELPGSHGPVALGLP